MTSSARRALVCGATGMTAFSIVMLAARTLLGHESLSERPQVICLVAGVAGLLVLLILSILPNPKPKL